MNTGSKFKYFHFNKIKPPIRTTIINGGKAIQIAIIINNINIAIAKVTIF